MTDNSAQRKIYTVSELTRDIKRLLEERYPFIWLCGEISNVGKSPSGHLYFTLKDEQSQVQCVMFRGQLRNIQFEIEDGLSVTGLGRISVYEPRGAYQLIFEYIEPQGIGALQIAFEQLKEKLAAEGLFDERHKKPLPFLPRKISLITSPTGAVVHDILKVAHRRYPNVHLEIVPVKVQGQGADDEIVTAFDLIHDRKDTDLIILARGGGSIEDLAPFNAEKVVRAIFASEFPVVSAVGHETDFSIADFVADLRAPTPSAAAELALPVKDELLRRCHDLRLNLKSMIYTYVEHLRSVVDEKSKRLINPKKKIADTWLKLDDLAQRLIATTHKLNQKQRERIGWWTDRLYANSPTNHLLRLKEKLSQTRINLSKYIDIYLSDQKSCLRDSRTRLDALSPASILSRGYSITQTIPDLDIVRDSASVLPGQALKVTLAKGSMVVDVKHSKTSQAPDNKSQ